VAPCRSSIATISRCLNLAASAVSPLQLRAYLEHIPFG
jgi:hypothetical protein